MQEEIKNKDISSKVVISLMFLTIVVTFIGTLLIFSSMQDIKTVKTYEEYNNKGKIGINIIPEPTDPVTFSSAKVGIDIIESPNQS